jgi:hypothetical protein
VSCQHIQITIRAKARERGMAKARSMAKTRTIATLMWSAARHRVRKRMQHELDACQAELKSKKRKLETAEELDIRQPAVTSFQNSNGSASSTYALRCPLVHIIGFMHALTRLLICILLFFGCRLACFLICFIIESSRHAQRQGSLSTMMPKYPEVSRPGWKMTTSCVCKLSTTCKSLDG